MVGIDLAELSSIWSGGKVLVRGLEVGRALGCESDSLGSPVGEGMSEKRVKRLKRGPL